MNEGLVDIFRALKNPTKFGLIMGIVTADFPEIQIDIGDGIILEKEDLLFSAGILKDYERQYSIESEDAQLLGDKLNSTGSKLDLDGTTDFSLVGVNLVTDSVGASATPRPVATIPEGSVITWSAKAINFTAEATDFDLDSQDFKSTGKITLTDEIVVDDKVMLMATETNQLFYVIDKVISF